MAITVLLNKNNFPFIANKWEEFQKTHPEITLIEDTSANFQEFESKIANNTDDITSVSLIAGVKNDYNLDAKIFDALPNLKAVCFCSAGYNQIDFAEATKRKIQVARVYDLDTSTADTNLFLLLGAMRFYQESIKDLYIHHKFQNPSKVGIAPNGLTLGVVGLGAIGQAVVRRCLPLGFEKIIYYNRRQVAPELEKELGVTYVSSIDELVSQSDVVDLNCALTPETYHLINEERILKMKDEVIIVNTARGDVIDETALIKYLKNGKILSAGLDVFHNEPNINYELVELDNVIALPHVGSFSKATRINAQLTVLKNVENYLSTGKLISFIGEQRGLFD
ncbi:hypothetical protein DASC09_008130 [Saccharomycopsis crataegensis]|uniref:Glyoxylate reductase n=1 Tax=Saccharomycopsis crataegensis TaxID=43959 RepID=A0AAV5QFH6_9ASCO|nr:hypothetical protein DASC09_008130 [Saccharomycopsis crataegensis]